MIIAIVVRELGLYKFPKIVKISVICPFKIYCSQLLLIKTVLGAATRSNDSSYDLILKIWQQFHKILTTVRTTIRPTVRIIANQLRNAMYYTHSGSGSGMYFSAYGERTRAAPQHIHKHTFTIHIRTQSHSNLNYMLSFACVLAECVVHCWCAVPSFVAPLTWMT